MLICQKVWHVQPAHNFLFPHKALCLLNEKSHQDQRPRTMFTAALPSLESGDFTGLQFFLEIEQVRKAAWKLRRHRCQPHCPR
jgi:hypothetical protein